MDHRRAVLVTGASSGIGRKITEYLAAIGCLVYAGVRKDADLRALGVLANVRPLRLDVLNVQHIRAAVDVINADGRALYGLVNNAGVGTVGPVVGGSDSEFELVMSVNVHGPYRVTQAFAPAIIAAQGRIVMMGSISGILADSHVGPYSMSKHALEALTDCLALELEPVGVHVSIVEPGGFKTNILRSAIQRGLDPRTPDLSECQEPDAVAAAVAAALFEPVPRRRYLVVSNREEARRTISKQITQLVEINEGHAYTYDRDTLFKMIDEALIAMRRRFDVSDEFVTDERPVPMQSPRS